MTDAAPWDLDRAVTREMDAWEARLPYDVHRQRAPHPHPRTKDGLPDSWRLVDYRPDYAGEHLPDTDLALARRDGGGWVVLRHERDIETTKVFWIDATLGDLYTHVREEIAEAKPSPLRLIGVDGWLREVLIGMYDPSDPEEAAEQMLFALSGNLGVLPDAAA